MCGRDWNCKYECRVPQTVSILKLLLHVLQVLKIPFHSLSLSLSLSFFNFNMHSEIKISRHWLSPSWRQHFELFLLQGRMDKPWKPSNNEAIVSRTEIVSHFPFRFTCCPLVYWILPVSLSLSLSLSLFVEWNDGSLVFFYYSRTEEISVVAYSWKTHERNPIAHILKGSRSKSHFAYPERLTK